MSKLQLKKELQNLDAVQLRELILDIYSARKEAKEYLEFFLNPDVAKLTEKYQKAIDKEMNRVHKRLVSPRITRIKKMLKEFDSFGTGAESELELRFFALTVGFRNGGAYWMSETAVKGLRGLMAEMLKIADLAGYADTTVSRIAKMIDSLPEPTSRRDIFKSEMIAEFESYTPPVR